MAASIQQSVRDNRKATPFQHSQFHMVILLSDSVLILPGCVSDHCCANTLLFFTMLNTHAVAPASPSACLCVRLYNLYGQSLTTEGLACDGASEREHSAY